MAIRIAELPDSSLVARRLAPCRHVVCGAPGYFRRRGLPRTPEELTEHNAITFQYQSSAHDWHFITPEGKSKRVAVTGNMQMNNSLALREALLSEAGLTLTPTFVVGADIQAGKLQAALTDHRALELSIYAIFPQHRHLSPKVRAFIDFIAERFSGTPYWDLGLGKEGRAAGPGQ